jgi:hypothetical protein
MDAIDKRLHGAIVAGVAPCRLRCGEQRAPGWLNHPINDPFGMGDAQRSDGRKGMENVAHGAETDHEEAKLGLGLQILIFS